MYHDILKSMVEMEKWIIFYLFCQKNATHTKEIIILFVWGPPLPRAVSRGLIYATDFDSKVEH